MKQISLVTRNWWSPALCAALALAVGLGVVLDPFVTIVAVVGLLGSMAVGWGLLLASSRLQQYWLISVGILLVGYAFFDRSFAYLGIAPLFVGEVVLGLGILVAILTGGVSPALRSPLVWLWICLATYGTIRTVPYVFEFGFDALRDAVLWGYGFFALLTCAFLLRSGWVERVHICYARFLPWFLLWAPAVFVIRSLTQDALPTIPGTDVIVLFVKPADIGVHLAGAGAFFLLGLHESSSRVQSTFRLSLRDWVWSTLWFLGAAIITTLSRTGYLAMFVAILAVLIVRPRSALKGWRVACIGILIIASFLIFNVEIRTFRGNRPISLRQIRANIVSIFGDAEQHVLEANREFRIEWWNDIIDYTIFGDYFWTGKGFGLDLTLDSGITGHLLREGLRSPHNAHLTFLARTGVPGLTLWLLLQAGFGLSLLRAYFRARQRNNDLWARLVLWILAYWSALTVANTFEVFLESPHSGIWFWCLSGFGIAVLLSEPWNESASARKPNEV